MREINFLSICHIFMILRGLQGHSLLSDDDVIALENGCARRAFWGLQIGFVLGCLV